MQKIESVFLVFKKLACLSSLNSFFHKQLWTPSLTVNEILSLSCSGHELEMMEAQAKDSEDEAEDVAKR